MNELQITLLVVGGGSIAAMITYNWWQDYRVRRRSENRFGMEGVDPLVEGEKTEPVVGDTTQFASSGNELTVPNELETEHDKNLFADFFVHFDSLISSSELKPLIDELSQSHNKAVLFSISAEPHSEEGGDELVQWYKCAAYTGPVAQLRVSTQLANRKGPLNAIEFSNLLNRVRKFTEDHEGDLHFPEMKKVVSQAENLDRAAAALDTLIGLHCMLPDQVTESLVIEMLTDADWQRKGHQWQLFFEGNKLATMVVHRAPEKRLLSFNIDVPNSSDPIQALGDIVTFCHKLNEKFGAPLVDDSGQTLTTEAIEAIYNQLVDRVKNLGDAGFKPGSRSACVLFS